MRADPKKWEESWTRDLNWLWKEGVGKLAKPGASFSDAFDADSIAVWASEPGLVHIHNMTRCVCALQHTLGCDVSAMSMVYDFETDWRASSDEHRRHITLEGICRAMADDDLHSARRWCPDSTLDNLTSERGETYIHLLRLLLPQDLAAAPVVPTRIPHPAVDRNLSLSPALAAKPGHRSMAAMIELGRTHCMTRMVREIFFAFVRCSFSFAVPSLTTSVSVVAHQGGSPPDSPQS